MDTGGFGGGTDFLHLDNVHVAVYPVVETVIPFKIELTGIFVYRIAPGEIGVSFDLHQLTADAGFVFMNTPRQVNQFSRVFQGSCFQFVRIHIPGFLIRQGKQGEFIVCHPPVGIEKEGFSVKPPASHGSFFHGQDLCVFRNIFLCQLAAPDTVFDCFHAAVFFIGEDPGFQYIAVAAAVPVVQGIGIKIDAKFLKGGGQSHHLCVCYGTGIRQENVIAFSAEIIGIQGENRHVIVCDGGGIDNGFSRIADFPVLQGGLEFPEFYQFQICQPGIGITVPVMDFGIYLDVRVFDRMTLRPSGDFRRIGRINLHGGIGENCKREQGQDKQDSHQDNSRAPCLSESKHSITSFLSIMITDLMFQSLQQIVTAV